MDQIELLAPAKNLESAKAAIQSGADAVYIGAHMFGARAAAGNSTDDIKLLIHYAHLYNVKVYVTINTLIYNDELSMAQQLCYELYDAGADALIIQDFGLLQMELPPIPVHASTQTHNYSVDKVKFLEQAGFARVILARELSLEQIKEIRSHTNVELESFIHGSLCVSFSGRCYLSHYIGGRSANRGDCAQPCRNKYNLEDEQGHILIRDKHLLSLHDLNLSNYIGQMMDAGITSFKIEGRLKDLDYVKNITAYYRQLIDKEIMDRSGFIRASSGKTTTSFIPDPYRSFNRGFTPYFIEGRKTSITSPATPKSIGKKVGIVTKVTPEWITAKLDEPLLNGDGICWSDAEGHFTGARVNVIREDKILLNNTSGLKPGDTLMRNFDKAFTDQIEREDACNRTLDISLTLTETDDGIMLEGIDEDGLVSSVSVSLEKTQAKNPEVSIQKTKEQLQKSGQTMFRVINVEIRTSEAWFFQSATLNQLRRDLLMQAQDNRLLNYKKSIREAVHSTHAYPFDPLTQTENIANKQAEEFYSQHGLKNLSSCPEIIGYRDEKALMTTKMCLRYETGNCPTYQKANPNFSKTMYLSSPEARYRLSFDCKNCVMRVFPDDVKPTKK